MKKFTMFACLALALVFAVSSFAEDIPRFSDGNSMVYGAGVNFEKAGGDTINLMAPSNDPNNSLHPIMGMEPFYDGDFEDDFGNPDWNGWSGTDLTEPPPHFHVSTYGAVNGMYSVWCGDPFILACNLSTSDGGYGNNWHDILEFRKTIPNPGDGTTVNVTATLVQDSEPGFDLTYLSYQVKDDLGFTNVGVGYDDNMTYNIAESLSYLNTEYLGLGEDEIAVFFRFVSDGAWSDGDCLHATDGACRLDDITMEVTNGAYSETFVDDFETGDLGANWAIGVPLGVGDYAQLFTGLQDVDVCRSNLTTQVAFIDDGLVVDGTGGTSCNTWCYAPGGFVVNMEGGLAGPTAHINNAINSPIMDWPVAKDGVSDPYDGISLEYDVYRHFYLGPTATGIFYVWGVRSADTDGSAGNGVQNLTSLDFADDNFVYYGQDYLRDIRDLTNHMNPGRDEVQVQLGVYELGWVWGFVGTDGSPAPYFDNVKVKIYPFEGPAMSGREIDLAQDNFPSADVYTLADLGSHSVRFDMANNIALAEDLANVPGDSIVLDIVPVRPGADFNGIAPVMHWALDPNPVFNPHRTTLDVTGTEDGMPAVGSAGTVVDGKWAFDLPDSGFLFPGDVLHYYFEATDYLGGADPQSSQMPGDIDGFGVFGDPLGYNSSFVVHALPTLAADGGTPDVLFINDFANRGGENHWYTALNNIGYAAGVDYDIYYVNGPSSGVGNGIGGRANPLHLSDVTNGVPGYQEILYTSGDLSSFTISNGDFLNDPGNDSATLKAWLDSGGKDIFLTGDDLATDLSESGPDNGTFLSDYLGLSVLNSNLSPSIGNQTTPLVRAVAANPVFNNAQFQSWVAFGGCIGINTFDAASPIGGATPLAAFMAADGVTPYATYSAATLKTGVGTASTSRVITMPYDLMFVYTDPDAPVGATPLAGRTQLLRDVMIYFGNPGDSGAVTPVLPGIEFATSNYPNPFNPSTTIKYTMPKTGHLSLKVYNVRGQLVKTLIDGQVQATDSGSIVWDGSNNQGSNVSSGVYFYEARTDGKVKVQKMALVK